MQRRRERINERLKILQKLVPNGTKVSDRLITRCVASARIVANCPEIFMQVDISTMLEEAVQYVRFLQLQIKVNRRACFLSDSLQWHKLPASDRKKFVMARC
jgi:hypothetical protein